MFMVHTLCRRVVITFRPPYIYPKDTAKFREFSLSRVCLSVRHSFSICLAVCLSVRHVRPSVGSSLSLILCFSHSLQLRLSVRSFVRLCSLLSSPFWLPPPVCLSINLREAGKRQENQKFALIRNVLRKGPYLICAPNITGLFIILIGFRASKASLC